MKGTFVFINMATRDVAAAREFYETVGFEINTMFSNDSNVFISIAETVQLVLGKPEFFARMGERREFVDAESMTEASIAISAMSREQVDEVFDAAIAAGGRSFGDPVEEKEIGLYARAFYDLDGHKIDINYMPMQ